MSEVPTILLVEDDRYIALALQIRLSAAGYEVLLAHSVATALEAVEQCAPSVALLDVNLPDGNGLDLMQTLLEMKQLVPVLCIVMSASRKPGLIEQAIANGASAFVEKPFSSKELIDIINGATPMTLAS